MAHAPNRTHLPPVKSAEEYEREIAELKGDYGVLWRAISYVVMDPQFEYLSTHTQDRVDRVLRNKPHPEDL